jgi:hypothetical protein
LQDDLTLDGNAVAGLLAEIFVADLTAAELSCDGCGTVAALGALRAYVRAPGAVLRCVRCEAVMLRVVRASDRCWLDLRGVRWLELRPS